MGKSTTGRFYVRSLETGRLYCVEPIGAPRTEFGASLDNFCRASIPESESVIAEENGFKNIGYAQNPLDYIASLERGERPSVNKY